MVSLHSLVRRTAQPRLDNSPDDVFNRCRLTSAEAYHVDLKEKGKAPLSLKKSLFFLLAQKFNLTSSYRFFEMRGRRVPGHAATFIPCKNQS
jgi:hypothetical protein